MNEVKKGLYHHFKGKVYEVIGTAVHTENSEELVIYHPYGIERTLQNSHEEFFENSFENSFEKTRNRNYSNSS